jgi:C-terminal peptidase prc
MLTEIERAYVEPPNFTLVAIGAAQALERLAPGSGIQVTESGQEARVGYRHDSGEDRTITFPPQMGKARVVEATRVLAGCAVQATPAIPISDLERALIVDGLKRLDPDSLFLDPSAYRELTTESLGDFAAVGLEVTKRDGPLTIVSPIDDTPGQRAGLQAGDRIERIDGSATAGMSLMDAVRRLRGKPGTKVTLTVARDGWPDTRDIEVRRERVRATTATGRKLGKGILYVRVRSFAAPTPDDVDKALALLGKDARGVVLDLRNNSGGLLSAGIEVAERFVRFGTLVAYTEGRLPSSNLRFVSRLGRRRPELPLVVLVNSGTAAGAEVVAAALQESARAKLIGMRTFGRASIQTIVPLDDGSALRLTTARWFSPKGRMIQGTGLTPDIAVDARNIPRPLPHWTTEELLERDEQLRAAFDHLAVPPTPQPGP